MTTNINVFELITDPDFARPFQIERHSGGKFIDGLYTSLATTFNVYGIIQPYQPKTVEYTENGDQITGDIKIWLNQPIYTTRHNITVVTREVTSDSDSDSDTDTDTDTDVDTDTDTDSDTDTDDDTSDSGISDIIIYKGERYKITYVKDWEYHGYYSAVAKRISAK